MEILKFSEPPKRSSGSRSAKRSGLMPMVTFGVAVLVLGGMSTTLAGTISLNTGGTVEFGQGVVTTAACDTSIKVVPTSSYDTATSGTYAGFYVSQIKLMGIGIAVSDTSSATQISAGCLGKTFKLTGYDADGTVVKFKDGGGTGTDQNYLSFTLTGDTGTAQSLTAPTAGNGSVTLQSSGYWLAKTDLAPNDSGSNTGTVIVSNFKALATLSKITVETSQ